jgi:hypothetical protein
MTLTEEIYTTVLEQIAFYTRDHDYREAIRLGLEFSWCRLTPRDVYAPLFTPQVEAVMHDQVDRLMHEEGYSLYAVCLCASAMLAVKLDDYLKEKE